MALPRLSKLFNLRKGFNLSGNKYAAARRIDNVLVGKNGRVTAGKRHAWFNSPVGVIRKPIDETA